MQDRGPSLNTYKLHLLSREAPPPCQHTMETVRLAQHPSACLDTCTSSMNSLSFNSSSRRPRTEDLRRRQRESDARILRGAEILKQQLTHPAPVDLQQQEILQQAPPSPSWKSRSRIQQETALIREDLSRSSASLGSHRNNPSPLHRRSPSPSPLRCPPSPLQAASPRRNRTPLRSRSDHRADTSTGIETISRTHRRTVSASTGTGSTNTRSSTPTRFTTTDHPSRSPSPLSITRETRRTAVPLRTAYPAPRAASPSVSPRRSAAVVSTSRTPSPRPVASPPRLQTTAPNNSNHRSSPFRTVSPELPSLQQPSLIFQDDDTASDFDNVWGSPARRIEPQMRLDTTLRVASHSRQHSLTQSRNASSSNNNSTDGFDDSRETYDFVDRDYDNDDVDIALAALEAYSTQKKKGQRQKSTHAPTTRDQRPLHQSQPTTHSYLPAGLAPATDRTSFSEDEELPALFDEATDDDFEEEDDNSKEYHYTDDHSPTSTLDPEFTRTTTNDTSISMTPTTPPTLAEYAVLLADPAYLHAQQAGFLWQSLVGQHVRFPRHWWDGARAPPLGADADAKWVYLQLQKVPPSKTTASVGIPKHPLLKKLVRNRASAGRLLLHIVVVSSAGGDQDHQLPQRPVLDMTIGVFHPNARGIRTSERSDKKQEDNRNLWFAVRKRSRHVQSVLETHWMPKFQTHKTPNIPHSITNDNVRVVFGEKSPMETIFVPEMELYDRLSSAPYQANPALSLLEDFVFS